ncbi:MAG: MFS transporter, partial [Caulobacteraceae bacterium]|nr:MFS transporter [Caulobacteraceae bacterium]
MSAAARDQAEDRLIHDAVGPPLAPGAAAACLAVGVNSLLVLGVQPVLLGALADEGRLTAAGIGQAATTEALAMGLATALLGLIRAPRGLRLIGGAASAALAMADLVTTAASGLGVILLRAAAGALEGVLLWIAVSMIARTRTPERWAGVFFTVQTL